MKLTIASLRSLIKEAFELPPNVEEVLSDMVTSLTNGETDVVRRINLGTRSHELKLSRGPNGYEARVDYDLFGTGKRPTTAANFIRKRLQFLFNDASTQKDPEKVRNADAKFAHGEMSRREKLDKDMWGKR